MPIVNVELDTDAPHLPSGPDQERIIDELIEDKGSPREVIRSLLILQGHLVSRLYGEDRQ